MFRYRVQRAWFVTLSVMATSMQFVLLTLIWRS